MEWIGVLDAFKNRFWSVVCETEFLAFFYACFVSDGNISDI
jgi:hypothetical protein